MLQEKNKSIKLAGGEVAYVAFGEGKKSLVILPGLEDGLRTVDSMEASLRRAYSLFAKEYRIYVIGRRNPLPPGCSSMDMAEDVKRVMDILGLSGVHVLGISQGGTVAQQLAIHYPQAVDRLVLAVTFARPDPMIEQVCHRWIDYAQKGDYAALFTDINETVYTQDYIAPRRRFFSMLIKNGRPQSFCRFIASAQALLTHNTYGRLGCIQAPTLIIGGQQDKLIAPPALRELAAQIPCSTLCLCPGYGHGIFAESPYFNACVLSFFRTEAVACPPERP